MRFICFLIGLALFTAPLPARAQVVISEVMWMGSDLSTTDEWLELARLPCGGDCQPLDLEGWTLTSLNSSGNEVVVVRFTVGTLLSGEYPLVVARQNAEKSRLAAEPDVLAESLSLPNTKLLLKLFDASGVLIDTVDDGVGVPFAGANPSGGTKASMERVDLLRPGTDKDNWRTATVSSGFDDGALMLGTPGSLPEAEDMPEVPASGSGSQTPPNDDDDFGPESGSGGEQEADDSVPLGAPNQSAGFPRVIIGAALPNPAGKDEAGEWIELKNLSPDIAVLSGWRLVGKGSSTKYYALDAHSIAGSAALRLTFAETQLLMTNTKFTLSLLDPSGTEVSWLSWESAAEQRVYRPNLYSELVVRGTVSRVIDGDTLEVVFDEAPTPDLRTIATVRLIGVDAPESVHPTKKPEPYGVESAQFLRSLLEKKKVELQFDTENWDVYDRLLAYVVVDEQILAQERLLSTGMARVYPAYAFSKRGMFDQYESHAKNLKVGIWSAPVSTSAYTAPAATQSSTAGTPAKTASVLVALSASGTALPVFRAEWSGLRISEIYAHPDTKSALPDSAEREAYDRAAMLQQEWIELRNHGTAAIALTGWKIRVGEGSGARNSVIRSSATVAPGARFVLPGSTEAFKLRDTGNTVALVAPDGTVVFTAVYPKLKTGQSWVVDDGEGCVSQEPTPGTENTCSVEATTALTKSAATKTTAAKKAPAPKKATTKKPPTPEFILSQRTIESLQSRSGGPMSLGGTGGASAFWQGLTFFLAAVALCQGGLMAMVVWKSGLLSGSRKLTVGNEGSA